MYTEKGETLRRDKIIEIVNVPERSSNDGSNRRYSNTYVHLTVGIISIPSVLRDAIRLSFRESLTPDRRRTPSLDPVESHFRVDGGADDPER